MAREPVIMESEFTHGASYVSFEPWGDGLFLLEVGHECVVTIRKIVPVEFVAAALTKAADHNGGIIGFLDKEYADYSETVKDSILAAVRSP